MSAEISGRERWTLINATGSSLNSDLFRGLCRVGVEIKMNDPVG
jgi:hypothetical protein